jgi:hypothetical protein
MTSLPEFLPARIAEDATDARLAMAALPTGEWLISDYGTVYAGEEFDDEGLSCGRNDIAFPLADTELHIARHDPARVLAECEAKRRIVEHWNSTVEWAEDPGCDSPDRYLMVAAGLYEAMRHLAEVFADHPDYQPEWRV